MISWSRHFPRDINIQEVQSMARAAKKNSEGALSQETADLYASGFFNPITEKCEGCDRIVAANNNRFCKSYAFPEAKWKQGICNFATHVKPETITSSIKINPLKASKRAMAKRKK